MQAHADAPGEAAAPVARYVAGQSCRKLGADHSYSRVAGRGYERCAKCGSTRTVRAKATEATPGQEPAAASAAAPWSPKPKARIEDLSVGTDARGDEAVFIEAKHFDGERLDGKAAAAVYRMADRLVFFRQLINGAAQATHGWVNTSTGRVEQWG